MIFLSSLKGIDVDDIQDIVYKLDDIASHGVTNLCEDYSHFVTPEEARICNKLFNSRNMREDAYENVSKRLYFTVYHLLYISFSQTSGSQFKHIH